MNRTTWGKCSLICGALMYFALPCRAQQTGPVSTPQPNCVVQFTFVAAGNSQVLDNRQVGCLNFTVTASVPSTVSALSLLVQTAQDNGSASCSTCSWTTFTAATGSNPITTTAGGNATFVTAVTVYPDFLRVQLTSITPASLGGNHVYGKLYSSIAGGGGGGGGGGGSGCAGTVMTPCLVAGPDSVGSVPVNNPVLIGGENASTLQLIPLALGGNGGILPSAVTMNPVTTLSSSLAGVENDLATPSVIGTAPFIMHGDGSGFDQQFNCPLQGTFGSSSSGNQQIIALNGSTNIRVCTIDFSTAIPENVTITVGTGANCGTGTTTIRSYLSVVAFDFEWGPLTAAIGGAGNAVCINPGTAQAFKTNFTYAQF
jgi:hypothetical protein